MSLAALGIAALLLGAQNQPGPAPREFRAAWIATVDNIDWPSKRDLTTAQQKQELLGILKTSKRAGLNALILQVRPSCDSLYESKLEPWSEFLTGQQGRAPEPKYDPLAFAVEEAHKLGIELHAWFNPYRAKHPAMKGPLAESHIANTNPDVAKTYGTYLWLDPGEQLVQKRSLEVMLDVVRRYDIDGVHIDDYFYPYPVKANGVEVPFPDDKSYGRYTEAGGTLGLKDWRRKNVDDFIEKLYKGIKSLKRWVKFGISPFGIYRPGVPETIKAGVDQYDQLYADARKWFVQGWCDYFTPQLYWPIAQVPQSYPVLLKWWTEQNESKRHLWPGNFTSRVISTGGDWAVDEILNQIKITRETQGAGGNVHFSMKALMQNPKGLTDSLRQGPYKSAALVPASPWLGSFKLAAPKILASRGQGGWVLTVSGVPSNARFLGVYVQRGGKWSLENVVGASIRSIQIPSADGTAAAVSFVDRVGKEGPRKAAALR